MSSPAVGRHCCTTHFGRKWFATSLRISLSSTTDNWNRCGCEAAMAGRRLLYKQGIRASEEMKIARRKKRNGGVMRNG
jgi:hypothetical protein